VETELPYKAAESGKFYLMTTQNRGMRLKFSNFTVPCGTVTFDWKMVVEDQRRIQKSVVVANTTTSDDSGTTVVSVSNLNLRHGGTYGIVVTARNIRGDSQVVLSDPILVDITPPRFFGTIRDGDAKDDIQYQYNTRTMSAYWNPKQFIDRESGIDTASFKVGVGLWTSQGIRARSFTSSYANRAVLTNLTLQNNTRYYIVVSVANRAGLTVEVASNGVLVDTTRPVTGKVTVQDAFGQTLDYQTICSRRIRATIANFKDDESGLILFQWRLCRRPHNISGSVSCSQQSYTSFNCSPSDRCSLDVYHGRDRMVQNGCFVHGYTYQLYIRVKNRAGLFSYSQTSNRFTVDTIPPTRGLVADGLGEDIDYQSDDQFLSASWTGFNDDISGIHFYELTAFEEYGQPNKRVTVASSRVFNTEQWRSSKLSLITGRNYYIKVVCYDKAGLFTETTSDGVMVDSLPPVAGEILDIDYPNFLEDIDYQISTSEIHTKWSAFQSASGIESCQWALSTSTDTINFGDVASERVLPANESSYSLSIHLKPYIRYYASLRCTSKAGLVSAASFSDGVTPDPSPPTGGSVFDLCTDGCGYIEDIDYSASYTALTFRWSGFEDLHSGIVGYEWNYATCGSKFYRMAKFISLALRTNVTKTGLFLNHNERYCITVRATNAVGAKTDVVSDGVLIDNTAPKGGFVLDGSSSTKDIDYQYETRVLSYTWEQFIDPESMIDSITISVGSQPGFADVGTSRTFSTTATSHTFGALLLRHDRVYYGTVCATNKARIKTCVRSDGVLIDTSPPKRGIIIDGLSQPDIDYQSNDHTVTAHWFGFNDIESNIRNFHWGIGTSPKGTDVLPFIDIGSNVTAEQTDLKLTNGRQYYVTVQAFNAGGQSVTKASDGVLVDTTPPMDPNPAEPNIEFRGSSVLIASWNNFTDEESPIWFYKWAVGTRKCGTQVQAYTNVGRMTKAKLTGTKFESGSRLYVSVVARNRADLVSQVCSDGYLFDITPPKPGKVRDGLQSIDSQYLTVSDSVAGNWDMFGDPESGIATCYFGVGTTPSHPDVSGYTEIGNRTAFNKTGLNLSQGVTYYVHIKCTNGVGLNTTEISDGVLVDMTEPVKGTVSTIKYQVSVREIRATWSGFSDPETQIESYSWAIGTESRSSTDIMEFVDVGPRRSGKASHLSLTPFGTYYVSVRAYNRAGLYKTSYSEGLIVDNSPPFAGIVQDGQGTVDVDWLTVTKSIGAKWNGFHDPQSAIKFYLWAVGTKPGGNQVMDYTRVDPTEAYCSTCVFNSGSRYFITVDAVNGVGMETRSSSDGFAIDITPPELLPISNVTWRENVELAFEWPGGSDDESGPLQCWLVIDGRQRHLLPNSTRQTILFNISEFQPSSSIAYSVQCVNQANFTTTTPSLFVDASPPSPGKLKAIDITGKAFAITWTGFEERQSYIAYYEWSVSPCLTSTRTFRQVTQSGDFKALYTVEQYSNERCFDVLFRAVNSVALASNYAFLSVQLPQIERLPNGICCDIRIQYTSNEVSAAWSWKQGLQDSSKRATYRWAVGTMAGGSQILPYTMTGNISSGRCSRCSVLQGATYFVTVHASIDHFNTFVSSQSVRVIIDFTRPERGVVGDGNLINEVDYFRTTDLYSVEWSDFKDRESGIANCTVTVIDGTGTVLWSHTILDSDGSGNLSNIVVPWNEHNGQKFKSVVSCSNAMGLISQGESDGFIVDGTQPTEGKISFTIQHAQAGQAAIFGAWIGFTDKESVIEYYQWSLLDVTAMRHVTKFENVGNTNTVERKMLLVPGAKYKFIVKARNAAGLVSQANSSAVVYDITPPFPSYVHDGSFNRDTEYQKETRGLKAYWGQMEDNETSIARYEWAIGTTVGGEQIRPFESTGLKTEGNCSDCLLSSGATYYITVMAINGVGLKTTASSNGILVDSTRPSLGVVFDGSSADSDVRYQNDTTSLSCTWTNFTDKESQISMYSICFSSDGKRCDISVARNVDAVVDRSTATGLRLADFATYYAVVVAVNGAGLRSAVSSDGVTIDVTPPKVGYVYDGKGHDLDCIWNNESLHVSWSSFYDGQSGVVKYDFAVGSKPDADEFVSFTPVGLSTNATCSPLWAVGQTAYVTVAAYNEAGGRITASSDGIKVLMRGTGTLQPEDCVSIGYKIR
jgi:hypothetical protein